MTDKTRGVVSRAQDFYLNNRYVQAASAAFCCGVFGLSFGLMLASLFTVSYPTMLLIGAGVGLSFGAFAAHPKLFPSKPTQRPDRDATTFMATFIGSALMLSCGATLLGITGNWNLLVATVCSVLVSLWLTFNPR